MAAPGPATIAVVGSLVEDLILHGDGTETRSLGGIAYAVGALAALCGPAVRILPISRASAEARNLCRAQWATLGNVATGGLVAHAGPQTRVRLKYGPGAAGGTGDRTEVLSNPMAPLQAREVEAACGADLVLVNCISGFDLTLAALERLARGQAPIYLDVHSLTLGLRADGLRVPQRPAEIEDWVACADVVQCNLREAEAIRGGCPEEAFDPLAGLAGERPHTWLLTRGAAGARLLRRDRAGVDIPAPPISPDCDPTGAGDVLGAAYVAFWHAGLDPEAAARRAVAVASASCRLKGSESLSALGAFGLAAERRNRDAGTP